uniref:Uncharacterized protein n=1 Tax=Rhizophora mucronata TaxID=61149 RepID=A0A2P2IT27_RHIMU
MRRHGRSTRRRDR